VTSATGRPVLIDLGRLDPHGPAAQLARRCDVMLLVVRGDVASLGHARAADWLDNQPGRAGFALIDSGLYRTREVIETLGIACLGEIPYGRKQPRTRRGARAVGALWTRITALANESAPGVTAAPAEVSAR
jgi:hypothetical protein